MCQLRFIIKRILTAAFFVVIIVGQSGGKTQGAVGAVTIDGKIWNQIALRPIIPIGKFGVALDLVFYFDEQGHIHKDEWDFSDGTAAKNSLIDKIYYIRYGFPGDKYYGKIGALDRVNMGYGILVNGYSNAILYPQERKIGFDFEMNSNRLDIKGFVNDFKENIGVFGFRAGSKNLFKIPISLSFVADRNQYLGLKDSDGDGRPNVVDDFPNLNEWWIDSDGDGLADNDPIELDIDGDGITDTLDSNVPGWNGQTLVLDQNIQRKNDPVNVKTQSDPVYAVALDIGYPLFAEKRFSISLYAQAAKLIGETKHPSGEGSLPLGMGLVPFGASSRFGPARFSFEYRMVPDGQFEFGYWNRSYEIERITFLAGSDGQLNLLSKESKLGRFGKQKGFYGKLTLNLGSLMEAGASYQNMLGEMWSILDEKYTQSRNQNFIATLRLRKPISKLHHALIFYQQRNVPNPFKFSVTESTLYGYKLGISMGSGLVLNYTFRRMYRDLDGNGTINGDAETIDITTIETSFIF